MNASERSSSGHSTTLAAALVKREIWILILAGALIFVVAGALEAWAAAQGVGVLQKGLQDLGVSFVEAALVMVIIDLRASREQITQSLAMISQATTESKALIRESIVATERAAAQSEKLTREAIDSVFKSVYQKDVPEELVQHYEATVFGSNFFRRDDEFVYTLRMAPGAHPDDFMQVGVYHKYTMCNLTNGDLEYTLLCETSLPPNPSPIMPGTARFFDLRVDGRQVPIPDSEVKTVPRPGYRALVLTHKVPIRANASHSFELRWSATRRVRDAEVLITAWPSNGIEVSVYYDQGLDVSVNALHPKDLVEVPTGDNSSKWSLAAGMIQGQGVCLSWEPGSTAVLAADG